MKVFYVTINYKTPSGKLTCASYLAVAAETHESAIANANERLANDCKYGRRRCQSVIGGNAVYISDQIKRKES